MLQVTCGRAHGIGCGANSLSMAPTFFCTRSGLWLHVNHEARPVNAALQRLLAKVTKNVQASCVGRELALIVQEWRRGPEAQPSVVATAFLDFVVEIVRRSGKASASTSSCADRVPRAPLAE